MKRRAFFLLVVAVLLIFIGCASPYAEQREALKDDYEAGKISAEQYYQLSATYDQMDQQRRAAIGRALQNVGSYEPKNYYPYAGDFKLMQNTNSTCSNGNNSSNNRIFLIN